MPLDENLPHEIALAVRLARLKQQQADRYHERVALLESRLRPPDPSLRDPRTTDSDSTYPRVVARVLRDLAFAMRDHLRQVGCCETDRMLNYVAEAEHTAYLLTRDTEDDHSQDPLNSSPEP